MDEFVRADLTPPIAVVTLARPPLNLLDGPLRHLIAETVVQAQQDADVLAIVIRRFAQLRTRDASLVRSRLIHACLRKIEDSCKPVIAAIGGFAFGGGLGFVTK